MTAERQSLAHLGERAAEAELVRCGLTILARRFRVPEGEVDLIAREGEVAVMVEVKTRTGFRHGLGREAVGPTKQRRIGLAALQFVQSTDDPDCAIRFDVMEVIVLKAEVVHIEWIRAAFVPDL